MPSLPALPFYQDGDYTTPVVTWTSPRSYPLASDGDLTTYLYRRRYLVSWAAYVPTQPGTPDPLDASAYLIEEIPPAGGRTPLAEFERVYCALPAAHARPGSLIYSLPAMPLLSALSGVAILEPFYNGIARSRGGVDLPIQIYTADACVDSGIVSSPTGGTFTVSAGGVSTSALAYNASTGTIAIAINALAAISPWGTVGVSGAVDTGAGLTFTWPAYSPGFSINGSSLTTEWGHPVVASVSSDYDQFGGYRLLFSFGTDNSTLTSRSVAPTLNVSGVAVVASSSITDSVITYSDGSPAGRILVSIDAGSGNTLTGSFTITVDGVSQAFTFIAGFVSAVSFENGLNTLFGDAVDAFGASYQGSTSSRANLICYYRPRVNGGTFTLTIHGQTTSALAYDATPAQIETALDALTEIVDRGGIVECENSGITNYVVTRRVAFELVPPVLGVDASSLTGPGSPYVGANQATAGTVEGYTVQRITFSGAGGVRTLTLADHGIRAGMSIACKVGTTWHFLSTGFSVVDEDRLAVDTTVVPFSSASLVGTLGRLLLSFTPRAVRLRSSAETRYFLTGPAPAAVTLESIQPEALQLTPERFYDSLTAGETTIVFDESDVQTWRGPIYSKTLTTVSLAGLA